METGNQVFYDRTEAGQLLASSLLPYRDLRPLVVALPRGGVVVGAEVAKALSAPLDVLVTRKIGAPDNPEFGVGAIAMGGIMVFDPASMNALGLTFSDLRETIDRETAELERRLDVYRGNRHNLQVDGKIVILVDDGLATGLTAQAAAESIRFGNPGKLIFAAPVGSGEAVAKLRPKVDELVCLRGLDLYVSVGAAYRHFPQLTDKEVIDALVRAHREIKVRL